MVRSIAPLLSENTRRAGGSTFDQAFAALAVLVASSRFGAMTIAELNPDHGEAGGAAVDRFVAALVRPLASATIR